MAANSKIEWTKHTANLWWGCSEVHSGCDHCYARERSHRFDGDNPLWGNQTPRRRILSFWKDLNKYQRKASKINEVHPVFIGSMMDIFEKSMPLLNPTDEVTTTGELRDTLFNEIQKGLYPNLRFLFLTKRPSNINKYIPQAWKESPPENVIFGASVVNPPTLETVLDQLSKVKGKLFLSMEPQLAHIDLPAHTHKVIHWIIQGGESGPHRRPFDLTWAYSMKKQCASQGIPYFFKQIDKVQPVPDDLMVKETPW